MVSYFQINTSLELPLIDRLAPYKAVIIIDIECDQNWQDKVSEWLVLSGCKYMMAWGKDCCSWDDSVDIADIKLNNDNDMLGVITTWHDNEPLSEAFEFCKYSAERDDCVLENTVIIHISVVNQKDEMLNVYRLA